LARDSRHRAAIIVLALSLVACGRPNEQAALHAEQARAALAAGDFASARAEGLNALQISPKNVAARYVLARLAARDGDIGQMLGHLEIVVGEDFSLGKDRAGNVEKLAELGRAFGYQVTALPRIGDEDESISSTEIREAVLAGDVSLAARLLGRYFHVEGVVVHGAHFGRQIGYPTANIDPPADQVALADGIYASLCWLPDETAPRPAMTYVGTRPTVNSGPRAIETNILDFSGDLYVRRLKVELVKRLRPDENFPTLDQMVEQLGRDEAATRAVLSALG